MYSQTVIDTNIRRYEEQAGHRLVEISPARVDDWQEHLKKRRETFSSNEECERALTQEERLFIRNERVMSRLNFRYWAARYGTIQQDGGGVTRFLRPWGSQEILLQFLSRAEQEIHEAAGRGEPLDGLLITLHKARQLGATAIGCLLKMHRLSLTKHRRAMCASVDDDKIQELYDRDKLVYDNLPWYMQPDLAYDEKRAHIYFEHMDSRVLYQVSSQKSGLGVGRQFDIAHLTELSTWLNAEAVELDFFPTLPMSQSTLGILESTAYGRGNWWHDFTERVRKGASPRWRYLFIPWYVEHDKYRRQPPATWEPSEVTLLHAQKVWDTSHEFAGRQIMLTREQLYWYESTRNEYQQGNNLRFFLTNWPATPEESFQHSGTSAFSVELLDEMRTHAKPGHAWEITRA